NVVYKGAGHTSELATYQLFLPRELPSTMPQPTANQLPSKEARILLAIQAMDSDQSLTVRSAAAAFNVPRSTLGTRRAGIALQRDCEPKSKKLTKLEEEV
ncbi:hypothetical protein K505DRAFT_193946, partial [Melanomma pulvis-pyrius CBS 109.77]